MSQLALIRHAPTKWTEQGRIQGRTDVPLSPAGRAAAARWRLPPEISGVDWVSSPLLRARETVDALGITRFTIEPRLIEMDWGHWEGRKLSSLRAELGAAMAENEALGLDFRPDGGDSPRDVQARLRPWLAEMAATDQPLAAVTHKGVIRAILSLATDWDMVGPPPAKMNWSSAHVFAVRGGGEVRVSRLNVSLEDR